jgi:hypothetical protein
MSAADLDHVRRVIDTERARLVRLIAAVDAITSTPTSTPAQRAAPAPPTRAHVQGGELLSRLDAAAALGVSVRSLDRMIHRGDLATVRLGGPKSGRVMVPATELRRVASTARRRAVEGDNRPAAGVAVPHDLW